MAHEVELADFAAASAHLTTSPNPSGRRAFRSHTRAMSASVEHSASARQNRLSMHFPMLLPTLQEQGQTVAAESSDSGAAPIDASFLTALAAQERKVLELKEELQRAEIELARLKSQWAKHEEEQKIAESEGLIKLQPLQTTPVLPLDNTEIESASTRVQKEMDRRRAFGHSSRASGRTVFSGSRHTRTLSLLSPTFELPTQPTASPVVPAVEAPAAPRQAKRESLFVPKKSNAYKASRDLHNPKEPGTTVAPSLDLGMNILDTAIDHELLLRTGKKFATEIKDGLWTFWEDIRQATVGEEATQPPSPRRKSSTQTLRGPRRQGSKNSLRSSSRGSSVAQKAPVEVSRSSPLNPQQGATPPDLADTMFWLDSGIASSEPPIALDAPPPVQERPPVPAEPVPDDDAWDTWDNSPAQSRHSSYATSETNTAPSTFSDSPRTSSSNSAETGETPGKDATPWTALDRLSPISLKKTANSLMKEWDNP